MYDCVWDDAHSGFFSCKYYYDSSSERGNNCTIKYIIDNIIVASFIIICIIRINNKITHSWHIHMTYGTTLHLVLETMWY